MTAATLGKQAYLSNATRLDHFQEALFRIAGEFGWELRAWAILNNHYHWMGFASGEAGPLRRVIGKLHRVTAKELNRQDGTPGRKVWFQYWDTHITHQRSYLARLNYVHHNPVKHGVALQAANYRWCSAAWFAAHSTPAFRATVESFAADEVNVPDDF